MSARARFFREVLRRWYAPRRGRYPWRRRPSPYRVLVAEVMLQQTQVARVIPAYRSFVRRFPGIRALAAAPVAEVLQGWQGLGFNRRALALRQAARVVLERWGGHLPADPGLLVTLPGVGPYTAAAVASIAFGVPVVAVDTNVRRVIARFALGGEDVDEKDVRAVAVSLLDRRDPGSWNQAVMDFGREVCRVLPRCGRCPLVRRCAFRRTGGVTARRPRVREPFQGSSRQARGAVVRVLVERRDASLGTIVRGTGLPLARVVQAVHALDQEGLARAGPAALRGHLRGRVRLAD